MVRKEQFAVGAGLLTSALAFILSKSLAWFILVLGLGLIVDFYLRDLIWGADRLTKEEILKMPAEEYKAWVLGNRKTERWGNWRLTGYDAFKKQMRKLAREAIIFMLLIPFLLSVGNFAFLYQHKSRFTVVALDFSKSEPISCKDGDGYIDQGRVIWTCQKGVRTAPVIGDGIDLTAGLVPTEIPKAPVGKLRPLTQPPILDLVVSALWVGLYGFPIGAGLWALYRAIRFAITG